LATPSIADVARWVAMLALWVAMQSQEALQGDWQYLAVEMVANTSEGQEKYLRELSITPVGYFTGAIKKSLPCGVPQEQFCMAKMRNRNDFPKVSFTLDVI
jgi:hypothetical protein